MHFSAINNKATFCDSVIQNRLDHASTKLGHVSGVILHFTQALHTARTFLNFICVHLITKGRGINSHTLASSVAF